MMKGQIPYTPVNCTSLVNDIIAGRYDDQLFDRRRKVRSCSPSRPEAIQNRSFLPRWLGGKQKANLTH
jgi:hypothetical protein